MLIDLILLTLGAGLAGYVVFEAGREFERVKAAQYRQQIAQQWDDYCAGIIPLINELKDESAV